MGLSHVAASPGTICEDLVCLEHTFSWPCKSCKWLMMVEIGWNMGSPNVKCSALSGRFWVCLVHARIYSVNSGMHDVNQAFSICISMGQLRSLPVEVVQMMMPRNSTLATIAITLRRINTFWFCQLLDAKDGLESHTAYDNRSTEPVNTRLRLF